MAFGGFTDHMSHSRSCWFDANSYNLADNPSDGATIWDAWLIPRLDNWLVTSEVNPKQHWTRFDGKTSSMCRLK